MANPDSTRGIHVPAVVLALLLLAACGGGGGGGNTNPGQPPATASAAGTVLFQGSALSGATVTLFNTNTNAVVQTAVTDAKGAYRFAGIGDSADVAQDYQIWALKAGYGFHPSVGAGARVTRSDYTGQFQTSTFFTNVAIDFTVIDYVPSGSQALTGANFTAYDGSNPTVSLARTGQTVGVVPGDDGYLREGVVWPSSRFHDNQDGSVTDNLTGLIWLKDAGALSPTTWASAVAEVRQLASGACGLTDGSGAGDWRLPNLNELESLVDVSASNPALPAGHPFTHVSTGTYWSSTTYAGETIWAWALRMGDGRYVNDGSSNVKATSANAVWAVKGAGGGTVTLQATGQFDVYAGGDDASTQAGVGLTYPRWVDNQDGTVTDTVTGLIWLRHADAFQLPWATAVTAVNALADGQFGLTDGSSAGQWRMPNRNEMLSLADRTVCIMADFMDQNYPDFDGMAVYQAPIFSGFIPSQYYWTSTTEAADATQAWAVYSCDYGVYDIPKADTGYSLAVR